MGDDSTSKPSSGYAAESIGIEFNQNLKYSTYNTLYTNKMCCTAREISSISNVVFIYQVERLIL